MRDRGGKSDKPGRCRDRESAVPELSHPKPGDSCPEQQADGREVAGSISLLTALQLPAQIPAESWQKVLPEEGGCLIGEHLYTSSPFMMWLGKICSRTGIQAVKKKLL